MTNCCRQRSGIQQRRYDLQHWPRFEFFRPLTIQIVNLITEQPKANSIPNIQNKNKYSNKTNSNFLTQIPKSKPNVTQMPKSNQIPKHKIILNAQFSVVGDQLWWWSEIYLYVILSLSLSLLFLWIFVFINSKLHKEYFINCIESISRRKTIEV